MDKKYLEEKNEIETKLAHKVCGYVTKKGTLCKNMPEEGHEFCAMHQVINEEKLSYAEEEPILLFEENRIEEINDIADIVIKNEKNKGLEINELFEERKNVIEKREKKNILEEKLLDGMGLKEDDIEIGEKKLAVEISTEELLQVNDELQIDKVEIENIPESIEYLEDIDIEKIEDEPIFTAENRDGNDFDELSDNLIGNDTDNFDNGDDLSVLLDGITEETIGEPQKGKPEEEINEDVIEEETDIFSLIDEMKESDESNIIEKDVDKSLEEELLSEKEETSNAEETIDFAPIIEEENKIETTNEVEEFSDLLNELEQSENIFSESNEHFENQEQEELSTLLDELENESEELFNNAPQEIMENELEAIDEVIAESESEELFKDTEGIQGSIAESNVGEEINFEDLSMLLGEVPEVSTAETNENNDLPIENTEEIEDLTTEEIENLTDGIEVTNESTDLLDNNELFEVINDDESVNELSEETKEVINEEKDMGELSSLLDSFENLESENTEEKTLNENKSEEIIETPLFDISEEINIDEMNLLDEELDKPQETSEEETIDYQNIEIDTIEKAIEESDDLSGLLDNFAEVDVEEVADTELMEEITGDQNMEQETPKEEVEEEKDLLSILDSISEVEIEGVSETNQQEENEFNELLNTETIESKIFEEANQINEETDFGDMASFLDSIESDKTENIEEVTEEKNEDLVEEIELESTEDKVSESEELNVDDLLISLESEEREKKEEKDVKIGIVGNNEIEKIEDLINEDNLGETDELESLLGEEPQEEEENSEDLLGQLLEENNDISSLTEELNIIDGAEDKAEENLLETDLLTSDNSDENLLEDIETIEETKSDETIDGIENIFEEAKKDEGEKTEMDDNEKNTIPILEDDDWGALLGGVDENTDISVLESGKKEEEILDDFKMEEELDLEEELESSKELVDGDGFEAMEEDAKSDKNEAKAKKQPKPKKEKNEKKKSDFDLKYFLLKNKYKLLLALGVVILGASVFLGMSLVGKSNKKPTVSILNNAKQKKPANSEKKHEEKTEEKQAGHEAETVKTEEHSTEHATSEEATGHVSEKHEDPHAVDTHKASSEHKTEVMPKEEKSANSEQLEAALEKVIKTKESYIAALDKKMSVFRNNISEEEKKNSEKEITDTKETIANLDVEAARLRGEIITGKIEKVMITCTPDRNVFKLNGAQVVIGLKLKEDNMLKSEVEKEKIYRDIVYTIKTVFQNEKDINTININVFKKERPVSKKMEINAQRYVFEKIEQSKYTNKQIISLFDFYEKK